MATFRQILAGLTIIAKYEADYLDTHIFTTSQSQVWAGTPGGPAITGISDEDKEIMRLTGWFIANPDAEQELWVWSHFT
jgi:hypothetical protein